MQPYKQKWLKCARYYVSVEVTRNYVGKAIVASIQLALAALSSSTFYPFCFIQIKERYECSFKDG